MLSLFRRNLLINFILLFLLAAVLHAYYFIFPNEIESVWYPGVLDTKIKPLISNHTLLVVISLAFIYIQAIFVNNLVTRHKLSRTLSTIPAACFIVYAAMALEPQVFSTILIANLFFILALRNLFSLYKKYLPTGTLYNSGLYLGLAMLCYNPYGIYFIVFMIGLYSLRNLSLQESLQITFGFLTPIFFFWVYLFYNSDLTTFYDTIIPSFSLPSISKGLEPTLIFKVILSIVIILVQLVLSAETRKKKKFESIKKIEICYWFLLFAIVSILFMPKPVTPHLLIISVPLTILLGIIMENNESRILKEFLFILGLIGFFLIQLGVSIV